MPASERADDRGPTAASAAEPMTPAPTGESSPDKLPAAANRLRAHLVKEAFVAMFGRLDGLLGDRWTGAHDRLQASFPDASAELDVAESRVDEMAVAYIDGRAAEAAFGTALTDYERVYTLAAHLLGARDRAEEGRCCECGRIDLTIVVRDEQSAGYCRACWSPE